jgi:hypothetical protein
LGGVVWYGLVGVGAGKATLGRVLGGRMFCVIDYKGGTRGGLGINEGWTVAAGLGLTGGERTAGLQPTGGERTAGRQPTGGIRPAGLGLTGGLRRRGAWANPRHKQPFSSRSDNFGYVLSGVLVFVWESRRRNIIVNLSDRLARSLRAPVVRGSPAWPGVLSRPKRLADPERPVFYFHGWWGLGERRKRLSSLDSFGRATSAYDHSSPSTSIQCE